MPAEGIWFTNASAKRINEKWQCRAATLEINTSKQVIEEGEGSAQVGELRAVVLAAQIGAQAICVDCYAVWAGATQWVCEWGALNWEINRSPIWRTEDWQLLLEIARKTPFKMGLVKEHTNDNIAASNWNQPVDELARIREIKTASAVNSEWY